mmetsp:Transcript_7045/g.16832  ORF Transcript_7045/g.16832 Transcript_7045/m.16832 type:complete len:188 (-) Transcript_7045:33-596(-)
MATCRATRLLVAMCCLQLAAAGCHKGSRSDCDDHGVCVSRASFDHDPFFNQCRCDFCWVGARSCDFNNCLFFAIPLSIFFCCVCLLCCPNCIAAAAGAGAAGTAAWRRQDARAPMVQQNLPSSRVDAFSGANAPQDNRAQESRTFLIQCPAGVTPGMQVQAVTPEGFTVQAVVPLGVEPGQQFAVQY